MKIGSKVRICGGMKEFIGETGEVIAHERDGRITMNRVRLDRSVEIPGVGKVSDDLWANEYLRVIRRAPKDEDYTGGSGVGFVRRNGKLFFKI